MYKIKRMGWLKDYPDFRDYDENHEKVSPFVSKMVHGADPNMNVVDLRQYCSPVENQGNLGSCTAQAAVGILEYFEKRLKGKFVNASRLFVYKATRNLMGVTGDTGAYIRSAMGALAMCGAPPEDYWPYNVSYFDQEPTAFVYSLAQNYQAILYYRLDKSNIIGKVLLERVKLYLRNGLPSMFGFTVYNSIDKADSNGGLIPFPTKNEYVVGGHAVVAVGYDDAKTNVGWAEKGALLIRNSWGTSWGEGGYGWLPYEYVIQGLADDFWSLLKAEWVDFQPFSEYAGKSQSPQGLGISVNETIQTVEHGPGSK